MVITSLFHQQLVPAATTSSLHLGNINPSGWIGLFRFWITSAHFSVHVILLGLCATMLTWPWSYFLIVKCNQPHHRQLKQWPERQLQHTSSTAITSTSLCASLLAHKIRYKGTENCDVTSVCNWQRKPIESTTPTSIFHAIHGMLFSLELFARATYNSLMVTPPLLLSSFTI